MNEPVKNLTAAYLLDSCALQEGLRLGQVGVWRWKIDSEQLEWTQNLESVHHLPQGSFDGALSSFQRDLHPDDADGVWKMIMASIETGAPYKAAYRTRAHRGEGDHWIETSGGVVVARDGSRYLTGVCLDVTERVRNESELQRRLSQQKAVASFGSFAFSEHDFQQILDAAVQIAADVLDVPLTKVLQFADGADHLVLRAGRGWMDGLIGSGKVGVDRDSQAGYTLSVSEPVIVADLMAETRFSGPALLNDHKVRSGISVVIAGSGARPFGVFGIHTPDIRHFDQTDAEFLQSLANIVAGAARQALAADQQKLLVREMAHRAGNMLQMINSIAAQTFNAEADPQKARQSFGARLSALARSNYVVSRGGWTSTRLMEVVQDVMEPYLNRVNVVARDIILPPDLCFDMGLILHELATNSIKYGSLGQEVGEISVEWSLSQSDNNNLVLYFQWSDSSSRSETTAKGTGFGSKLVSALIERKWNGSVTVTHGVEFKTTLRVPVVI